MRLHDFERIISGGESETLQFFNNQQLYGQVFQFLDESMLLQQQHLPVAGRG
jgi:hypothetical protein